MRPLQQSALRALAVAAVTGALTVTTALVASPAHAATLDGPVVDTQTQFCSPTQSARTNVTVLSSGAQPQVGQDFQVLATVVGVNQCLTSQATSVNIALPAGVEVSPTGQSSCVTFASSNPSVTVTVPCVRSDAGNGFQRIDPQGATSWTLTRTGRNAVQVKLAVRASTAGQRTAFARVCDSGSSVICSGSPVANAVPSIAFTVASSTPPPAPPATITADRLTIRKVGTVCAASPCPDLATTSTSIKVMSYLTGDRPGGTWRIQRRGPGAASFSTIATKNVTAGAGYVSFTTTATGLQPGTTHRFRACFTPTGSTQVCGTDIALATAAA